MSTGGYNRAFGAEDTLNPPDPEVARELDRIRAEARARADAEGRAGLRPPPAPVTELAPAPPAPETPAPPVLPPPPEAASVNEAWRAEPPAGEPGLLRRWLERVLQPRLEAQVGFNARQVQLDNALLEWLARRFAATHEHYDRLHHSATRRMNDIDERHLLVQERLVKHVHELVRRIDFVLEASERSRLAAEAETRRLAARVEELEKRLGPG